MIINKERWYQCVAAESVTLDVPCGTVLNYQVTRFKQLKQKIEMEMKLLLIRLGCCVVAIS